MSVGSWFRTDFDEPSVPAALPLNLTSGSNPAITILDQVVRGNGIVGRVTGDYGAVAVKVHGTGAPARVSVAIGLDELATRWWADRLRPSRFAPELPRAVAVRAQGRIRGGAVLARRQGWRGAASANATVSFDLEAGELDADGMLIVEIAETPVPDWASGRLSARAPIGLRFNGITVRDRTEPAAAAGPDGYSGCDFTVVQPGSSGTHRLVTVGVPAAPPLPITPRNRLTRQKPARAVFKMTRAARRVAVRAMPQRAGEVVGVLAADLVTGEPVAVTVDREADGLAVRLAEPAAGPVLLGSAEPQPTLSWRLT
ncbi:MULTISPECIES: hypothetical protein [Actinoplanes]|uniref:hypothetical protein n=1 Tax=Actinoplanes TaxID=1865 RepID=UPI0005F2F433|nr:MULTISPECIES: hypothetical protein [Actinoplanes]GLY05986.1 hypothetical protein Acsp01_63650 [Actinoplanes sp. NBRC 101535]